MTTNPRLKTLPATPAGGRPRDAARMPKRIPKLPPRRGYQDEAVAAIVSGLAHGGRATAVLACGTGKTLVAAHATVQLVPAGLVVVACPSLALVAQTLRVWRGAGIPDAVLAVCSDATVADTKAYQPDLRCPVTTDPQQVTAWLRDTQRAGLRLVLVTHQSARVLGRGLHDAQQWVDLLVVDEAHRTAGSLAKRAAALHHDTAVPARRRLYMTATPKVMASRRSGAPATLVSMDDPDTYGPRLYTYPFAHAIRDGWLDDYRVVVLGVTRQEIHDLLRERYKHTVVEQTGASLHTMVAQVALIKAAAQFRLRRILVFTNLIKESQEFVATLSNTLDHIPPSERPKGLLTAVHVDGNDDVAGRQHALDQLVEPPQDGWAVVCNPGCLSEGVDVPVVDAVVFTRRKESETDIVQAAGRGLRRNPRGSGIATILVPVLVDDPDATTDTDERWFTLCQVVQALRAHDPDLAAHLDEQRARTDTASGADAEAPTLPPQVIIRLPDGYDLPDVLRHITLRVLAETTEPWWEMFGQLRAHHAEHGRLPGMQDRALANWQIQQRRHHARHLLDPQQITALESIGFRWAPRQQSRERGLAAAQQFHQQHGHLNVPDDGHRINGVDLYHYLAHQRRRDQQGTLPADLKAELTRMGLRFDPKQLTWQQAYQLAAAFRREHGHLRVPRGHTTGDFDLYAWVCAQRQQRRAATLKPEQVTALDGLDMIWDIDRAKWDDNFAAAEAFARREGHLKVPTGHREGDIRLHSWIQHQRNLRRADKLQPDQIAALDRLGMIWEPRRARWEQGFAAAEAFARREGHLKPSAEHREGDVQLHLWLHYQLDQYHHGRLSTERIRRLTGIGMPLRSQPRKRQAAP